MSYHYNLPPPEDYSVLKLELDPKKHVLKVETINGKKEVTFEERGPLTWIKAHLPSKFFEKWVGSYKLQDVHKQLTEISASTPREMSDKFLKGTNKVIKSWNEKNGKKGTFLKELDTTETREKLRNQPDYIEQNLIWLEKCYVKSEPNGISSNPSQVFGGDMYAMDQVYREKILPESCDIKLIYTLTINPHRKQFFSLDGLLSHEEATKLRESNERFLFILKIENAGLLVDDKSRPELKELKQRGELRDQDLKSDDIKKYLLKHFINFTEEGYFPNNSEFICQSANQPTDYRPLIDVLKKACK